MDDENWIEDSWTDSVGSWNKLIWDIDGVHSDAMFSRLAQLKVGWLNHFEAHFFLELQVVTLPETNSSPLKMMVSKFGISWLPGGYFQVPAVSFREGKLLDDHF